MTRRPVAIPALLAVAAFTSADSGSRDTYYAGIAGPYPIRVVVQAPGVIPGLARISVSLTAPTQIQQVAVQPVVWNVPLENAPAPDIAVRGEGGDFHAQLWLMVSGSYGVRVIVRGDRGEGTAIVPLSAVAYQRLEMPRPFGALLLGLAAFLAAGMITIVRSASRESVLAPGQSVGPRDRRRGWRGLAAASIWVTVLVVGGRTWWNNVDRAYRERLYRPAEIRASVPDPQSSVLRIDVLGPNWAAVHRRRPLVPDEGKLAHIFLVGDSAFAHLHPFATDSTAFQAALPSLPPGRYRIFVEVTDSTGFTQTLGSTMDLPVLDRGRIASRGRAPDGFWLVEGGQRDSAAITWHPERGFAFSVRAQDGKTAPIDWTSDEPADLLVLTTDGDIVHLRPHGTMPRAAIEHFTPEGTRRVTQPLGEVVFPGPPAGAPGTRGWIQIRAGGNRLVSALDAIDAGR